MAIGTRPDCVPDDVIDQIAFSGSTFVVILVGAVLAGLFAALYPSYKASNMDVLEAIALAAELGDHRLEQPLRVLWDSGPLELRLAALEDADVVLNAVVGFARVGGRTIQRSMIDKDLEWEIPQIADGAERNPKSWFAKTVQRDNETWGEACEKVAHGPDRMTCFACHSSWMASCFGCHLPMRANQKTEGTKPPRLPRLRIARTRPASTIGVPRRLPRSPSSRPKNAQSP